MNKESATSYRIVVDTDTYSGSFERELIAYATGQAGDCGVGSDLADVASSELPNKVLEFWEDNIIEEADDDGFRCPANIYPTPGFFNDGMGGHYPSTPEDKIQALEKLRIRVIDEMSKRIEQLKTIDVGVSGWTQEAIDRTRADYQRKIDDIKAKEVVNEYPAYQSVSVLCSTRPDQEVINSFISRSREYFDLYNKQNNRNVQVLDIVIQREVVITEKSRTSLMNQGSPSKGLAP